MAVEDLKWLGLGGIFIEACRVVLSGKRLFAKITFVLILPLCLIFLTDMEVSQFIKENIHRNQVVLQNIKGNDPLHNKFADFILSKQTLWIINVAYDLFVLMISLLANSAVVYATAHIYIIKGYIDDELSFRNVMYVLPKVLSRLIITFLWYLLFATCYTLFIWLILIIGETLLFHVDDHSDHEKIIESSDGVKYQITPLDAMFTTLVGIMYWIGLLYATVIWHLASVITVLEEDTCGKKAMQKGLRLIKGKQRVSCFVVLIIYWFLSAVNEMSWAFVECKYDPGILVKFVIGTVCVLFILIAVLMGLVVISVLYFVCKSYHDETINRASLECRLKAYGGEYV